MEQFERMDKEQQEEMARYKRPLMVEDADTKAKNIPAGKELVRKGARLDSSSDLINLLPTELLLLVSQVLGSSSLLTFVELLLTFHRSSPSSTAGRIWELLWLSARDGLRFVTFILISNPLVIIFIFITLNIVMRIKEREQLFEQMVTITFTKRIKLTSITFRLAKSVGQSILSTCWDPS